MIKSSVLPDIPAELSPIGLPLLAALDPHRPARSELLAAGVAPTTACALYPLNQFDAGEITQALSAHIAKPDAPAASSPEDFDRWLEVKYCYADVLHKSLCQPWLEIWLDSYEHFAFTELRNVEPALERWLDSHFAYRARSAATRMGQQHRSGRLAVILWAATSFIACSSGLPSKNAATNYFNDIAAKLLATGGAE